jgi:ectoine hydroxylase-related dioxygenase (phytanoyl-CoA dioxygenase family)
MIAVDASTPENGCPAVAPGHHLHGLYQHTNVGSFQFNDDRAPMDESNWLACPLARGDVLIYDNYMPHKSAKNESPNWRRALFGVYNSLEKGDFRAKYCKQASPPPRASTAHTNPRYTPPAQPPLCQTMPLIRQQPLLRRICSAPSPRA